MPFAYAVALTGSIATGKSTVARCLKSSGFEVIDADTIAHQILDEQHARISVLFGEKMVKSGTVDRKALGAIVFADDAQRKVLESLLHPLIYERIALLSCALDEKKTPYFVDIPLFYEGKHYPIDKVLVVYTPAKTQRQRLMQRENIGQEEAQKRIDMQMSIESKRQKAEYVIDNSATLAALEHACKYVKKQIVKDFT